MQAEIIALGTELTNGSKLDTNSQWLSSELAAVGVDVIRHSTIGDSMSEMVTALKDAARRAQLVIITGGLGPTLDDLTRQAMAEAAGVELQVHEPSLNHIRGMFASRGREMPTRNEIQAMFPSDAVPISNPRGTAPGIEQVLTNANGNVCRLVALPGVPSEMKPMFRETVAPGLAGSGRFIRKLRINCFGAGESAIEEMLGGLTARDREPEVGITASQATITLRIVARGPSVDACDDQLARTRELIVNQLGDLVFGYEDEELPDVVLGALTTRGETVSVIEDQTGGLVSEYLRSRDEARSTMLAGLVLGHDAVPPALVPPAVRDDIQRLADHAHYLFRSDHCVVVGKMAGNSVPIAVRSPGGVSKGEITVVGNPAIRQSRLSKAAINMLRLQLLRS